MRGAIGRGKVTKRITEDYVVEEKVDAVLVDATGGDVEVTLVPRTSHVERIVDIQRTDDSANDVTVVSAGSSTINGSTDPYVLEVNGSSGKFEQDDLSNWHVFSDSLNLLVSADASVVITPTADGLDLSAADAGVPEAPATNHLFLAANVISAETVTVGADVYEVEIVNTDSTDNTQGGDFVPLTDPLVVVDAVTNYPNVFAAVVVGSLIRIGTEIMRVTDKGAADLTFQRGVSGTTTATHANAADIFIGNGIAGGSTVAVGLVTTLTPAAFKAAFLDDFNSETTEAFTASSVGTGVTITADADGTASNGVATTETLTGAGNNWQSGSTFGGRDAGQQPLVYKALLTETGTAAPSAVELENTVGLIVWTRSNTGIYAGTLTGAFATPTSLVVGTAIPSGAGHYSVATLVRTDDNSVTINTWDVTAATGAAALADALLSSTYVEITVWP